jgi:hypothetical protein
MVDSEDDPKKGGLCAETTSKCRRAAFDALAVQRLPIHEAFHEAGSIGIMWSLSEVQKY